jgi:hypothetical protein
VWRGVNPTAVTIAEADTLVFKGAALTARNILLEQTGADLSITFFPSPAYMGYMGVVDW